MKHKILYYLIFLFGFLYPGILQAQYSWNWKDPNDLNIIDFGDNKVIGYNLVGVGLVYLLDKWNKEDLSVIHTVSVSRLYEYKRSPLSAIWAVDGTMGTTLKKYLSLGGGLRIYNIEGDGVHTGGLGGYVWFSWHIVNNASWKFGYTNGVGPNYFIDPYPKGGTRFNFTTHYGINLQHKVGSKWLFLNFVNWHISNANIKGAERNPAMDAIGIQFGFSL